MATTNVKNNAVVDVTDRVEKPTHPVKVLIKWISSNTVRRAGRRPMFYFQRREGGGGS